MEGVRTTTFGEDLTERAKLFYLCRMAGPGLALHPDSPTCTAKGKLLPPLPCKENFLSLIVQVPMGLMDFIATFVGRKVSGAL